MAAPRPIAFYFPWVRELTGAPRSALNLMLNLSPERWRPFLVTDRENALSEQMAKAGLPVEIVPLPALLGVRNHQGLRLSWRWRARALLALRRHHRELAALLVRRRAALLWSRNAKGVLYAAPGARAAGCRYVWDVGLEDPSRGPLYLLHSWALRQADLIVTQARRQPLEIFGERRRARFAHKFHCLPPGIEARRAEALLRAARSRPARGELVALCVGTVHPRKNQRLLLDAALPLLRQHSGFRLRFAGSPLDEGYARSLVELARSAGVLNQVEFLGWRDDIPELMAEAQLLVVSSDNEGVPQVVREAMFSGLAVVSSAVGGIPEVVSDARTGLLYPRGDGARLREHLAMLLANPEKVEQLGANARAHAREHFSLERWCRSYDDLLWSLAMAG
ncbi:MAG: glycosyltransferase family 4 protein [Myxococcota bacterium]|nr:glycosyltransferase family 4 protein [Myxococcota bacterium]